MSFIPSARQRERERERSPGTLHKKRGKKKQFARKGRARRGKIRLCAYLFKSHRRRSRLLLAEYSRLVIRKIYTLMKSPPGCAKNSLSCASRKARRGKRETPVREKPPGNDSHGDPSSFIYRARAQPYLFAPRLFPAD